MDYTHTASFLQTGKYFAVSSAAILAYDYLLTILLEVELVWRSSWSIVKILYLFARYTTFVDMPLILIYHVVPELYLHRRTCFGILTTTGVTACLGMFASKTIMIFRTYSLWGNNGMILASLMTMCLIMTGFTTTFTVIFLRSVEFGDPPPGITKGCWLSKGSKILFLSFTMTVTQETIIIILTLWAGIRNYRHSHRSRIISTLYRDGIAYFILVFLCSVANIIVMKTGPPGYVNVLNTFQRIIHSVLSTRIILHKITSRSSIEDDIMHLKARTSLYHRRRDYLDVNAALATFHARAKNTSGILDVLEQQNIHIAAQVDIAIAAHSNAARISGPLYLQNHQNGISKPKTLSIQKPVMFIHAVYSVCGEDEDD